WKAKQETEGALALAEDRESQAQKSAAHAEEQRRQAEWHKQQAEQNAAEAEARRQQAVQSLMHACTTVDHFLANAPERFLAHLPHMELVRQGFLERALAFYQQVAQQSGADREMQLKLGQAYLRLGNMCFRLGQHAQTEEVYRQTLEVLESLVQQAPAAPAPRLLLAEAYHNQAALLQATGRQLQAARPLQRALGLSRQLV